MSVEIRVPAMGESILEATVSKWLKREGEAVAAGEPVVELETEKVNVEVTAPEEGSLVKILKVEGETVTINEVLGTLGAGTAAAAPGEKEGAKASLSASAAEPAAKAAGEGAAEHVQSAREAVGGNGVRATPTARSIAAEHGIDLARIKSSGRGGRITREDVEEYVAGLRERKAQEAPAGSQPSGQAAVSVPAGHAAPRPSLPSTGTAPGPVPRRREEFLRLSRRSQTMARQLVEAHHTAVMTTTVNEIDMSAVMEVRRRRREEFKQQFGVNLGFMSFFVKAVVAALKAYPRLNSELRDSELLMKYYYDIGVAVGSEEGLVVPVLREADQRSFAEIEAAIADMAGRARQRKLTLEELQGGTFTISNGGVFGSLLSTPILNPPQVGILGMHRIVERPVAVGGQVVVRPIMYVALTYDHRVVEGREAVLFLVRVKELVEDPTRLLLEG